MFNRVPNGLDPTLLTDSAPKIPMTATPARSKIATKNCMIATSINLVRSLFGRTLKHFANNEPLINLLRYKINLAPNLSNVKFCKLIVSLYYKLIN